MCFSAKISVTSWWILAMISLFLWYRNQTYDRVLSAFIFTIGLFQLIEYGIYSGAEPGQSSRALFIILWVQCLVLAISTFVYIKSIHNDNINVYENIIETMSQWNLFLFAFVFAISLIYTFNSGEKFGLTIDNNDGDNIIALTYDNKIIYLYLLGIFIPLILILAYHSFDIGMFSLISYGVISGLYVVGNYQNNYRLSIWLYLLIGFGFLAWLINIFPETNSKIL